MHIKKSIKNEVENPQISTEFFARTYRNESGYLELIRNVLAHGYNTKDRTGVGSVKLISQKLAFDLRDGFPFHSVRPAPFRFAFEEYQAFLSGRTDIHHVLKEKGIYFWEGNTSREFLDARGLQHVPEGYMGKSYGFQLMNYGGELDPKTQQPIPDSGINQMKNAFEQLAINPECRRNYVTMLNPTQSSEMAMEPCWHTHQWDTIKDENGVVYLSLEVSARSADLLFGSWFNILQYAYLLTVYAKGLGMPPLLLTCEIVNGHLYKNQILYAKELLTRTFSEERCELKINAPINSFEDIVNLTWDKMECVIPEGFVNKTPFKTPKPPMAI